jgi:hypothetical protein
MSLPSLFVLSPCMSSRPRDATFSAETTPAHLNPYGLEIRQTAYAGRGVFASKFLERGLVVEVSPVLVLPKSEYQDGVDRSRLKDYVFTWNKRGDMAVALGLGVLLPFALPV